MEIPEENLTLKNFQHTQRINDEIPVTQLESVKPLNEEDASKIFIPNLSALKECSKELYKEMINGIARNIVKELKHSQARIKRARQNYS